MRKTSHMETLDYARRSSTTPSITPPAIKNICFKSHTGSICSSTTKLRHIDTYVFHSVGRQQQGTDKTNAMDAKNLRRTENPDYFDDVLKNKFSSARASSPAGKNKKPSSKIMDSIRSSSGQ